MATIQKNFDTIFRLGGTAIIVVGIFMVLQPFLSSMLVAGVLAISTWPIYERLRGWLGGNATASALVLMLLILLLVVIPLSMLAAAVSEQVPGLIAAFKQLTRDGIEVPQRLRSVPFVGEWAYGELSRLAADRSLIGPLLQPAYEPLGKLLLAFVGVLGDGILQLLLVTFVVFFYYRDGERIITGLGRVLERLSGNMSTEVLQIVTGTTRSVFIGIVGTAAAQAIVAFIGFLIAGVPGAFMLAVGTFVLSVVPMGPVLLWGGAAVWLYLQGETGWAIFMVIWGAVVISSIDNFLKPLLIARGSTLSLAMIFLGVFGGVLAFGFIGVILGPVLIALGVALGRAWIDTRGRTDLPAAEPASKSDDLRQAP